MFLFVNIGNTMRLQHFLLEDPTGPPSIHRQNINIEDGGVNQVINTNSLKDFPGNFIFATISSFTTWDYFSRYF